MRAMESRVENVQFGSEITRFIQSDSIFSDHMQQLTHLLCLKRDLYLYIAGQQYSNVRQFFTRVCCYSEHLLKLEQSLKAYWLSNLTCQSGRLLVFFYSEIYQYYFQANEIAQKLKKSDSVSTQALPFSINDINTTTVHLSIDFISQKGEIRSHSSNAPEFFGYSKLDFGFITNTKALIPYPINLAHDSLIEEFTSRPQTRFYCKYDECWALNKRGDLLPIFKSQSVSAVGLKDIQVECFLSLNERYQQSRVAI